MRRGWILPAAALAGVAIAGVVVLRDRHVAPAPRERPLPVTPPFASYIAGRGIVEGGSGDVAVGTPTAGVVAEVLVKPGDAVAQGQPLFRLDSRDLEAQVPVAAARVDESKTELERSAHELQVAERLRAAGVVSEDSRLQRLFDRDAAAATLAERRAEAERLRSDIERRTVRSPLAGRALRVDVRPGEFQDNTRVGTPLVIVGDDSRLTLRVDVDENDAARASSGARALAFLRGRPDLTTPLTFERIEPFLVPKTSLAGTGTERTDTRVLQLIFSFDGTALPVHPGEQLDVYIEASPAAPAATAGR